MLKNYWDMLGLFSRNSWLLMITAGLTGFGYVGIFIVLFNLYLLRLGFGPEFIGTINAAAQLSYALFSLPAGAIGQRWGIRRMTISGLAIGVGAFAILPLAEFLPGTWQAGWLMATYILAWLAGALYLVNAYPFLTASTSPVERSHVFSVRQALVPLGMFAGSLAGGLLPGLLATWLGLPAEHPASYRYVLFIGAGVLAIGVFALLATHQVSVEQTQQQARLDGIKPVGLIALMGVVMLLFVAGYNTARTFAGVYMDESLQMSTVSIGTLIAVSHLLAVPVSLILPVVIGRWGKRRTVIYSLLGVALSLLPLAFFPTGMAAGLGLMAGSLAAALATPALTICQQEIVPAGWRATMSGTVVMAEGLGTAIMAFGGGYLIVGFGYPLLFLSGAILTALGAGLMWVYAWGPRFMLMHRRSVSAAVGRT